MVKQSSFSLRGQNGCRVIKANVVPLLKAFVCCQLFSDNCVKNYLGLLAMQRFDIFRFWVEAGYGPLVSLFFIAF